MGPKCAGIFNSGKSFHSTSRIPSRSLYLSTEGNHAATNLLCFVDEHQDKVSETFRRYPPDLVELVLSAPAAGSIASRVKLYSGRRKNHRDINPAKLLKQIRRMCIDFRLLFWPGLSMNLQPIPCIPHGENDWKLGENGKVISRDELVAYLSRYGSISGEQIGVQGSE
jgi:hypothetical protein